MKAGIPECKKIIVELAEGTIPVDEEGLNVVAGLQLAVVTPGQ